MIALVINLNQVAIISLSIPYTNNMEQLPRERQMLVKAKLL